MSSVEVLSPAHWVYLLGVAVIVLTMIFRANVVVPSIVSTFLVTLAWTHSPVAALAGIFNASFVAAKELFNIFLVIAMMTALLNALRDLRSDVRMVEPFRKVMTNGHLAYLMLALITYLISLFFWPTPAVPLVAAVLLPAAIAAGLPPLACAMAIAIAGQGMALSSDYVIGVAPGISAKAAGATVSAALVGDRALVLSLITGAVALGLSYLMTRRDIRPASAKWLEQWQRQGKTEADEAVTEMGTFHKAELVGEPREPLLNRQDLKAELTSVDRAQQRWSRVFAVATPLAFAGVILAMVAPKLISGFPELKGGAAASLVGGTAAVLMMLATLAAHGPRPMLDASADHITDGFVFAFKAMGSVLPIAGFFFLGAGDTSGAILGIDAKGPDLLFEAIRSVQHLMPEGKILVAFVVLLVGMITGIDGSGFAGLPLTGALAGGLAPASGMAAETLAAIGQMGAVWTGGGTLVAWSSLIAVAGFARVPVLEAVRALLLPVVSGLVLSTLAGVALWN